ncbi:hypothetical protein H5410_046197 [Solanum commersonii]|uniref:Uncharacterized protein n=1 Tax=Solanum commersonii TaxID=4109 RepID=A0A9J5XBL5_SOLCO|nr:hypothetical protein H5410_046197 [Solanum commersonii]
MQYRSSAELANKFKIKREQLANERNDGVKKEQAPIPHKRKSFEDFIPQQGKSKLLGHKSVMQSSSREELRTSHMIAGKGQTKQRLFQSGESIQEKGIKLSMNNSRFQTSFKEGVIASVHVTGTTLGNGELKRKSVIPANSLDHFQNNQGIHIDDETKCDNHTIADAKFMHAPIINEHNKGLDDLVDQEELGGDECDVEEEIDIACSTKEIAKPKKVRGQTTCKDIHARNLEERKEVIFDKGQAMGPTNKIVLELSNFIGTIARNPRFINLMYTSWHAVPKDTKKCMWEYINSKFLIPVEGKKWVMTGLRDAWRRHKQKNKENFFDKKSTLEDMLAKCPDGIPENQFCQLIEYWKHPTIQAICEMNSQNRKKKSGGIIWDQLILQDVQPKTTTKNHQSLKCLLQLVPRREKKSRLNFRIAKILGKQLMMHLGQCLERSSLVDLGCVGSNLASPVDASSAQAVRGTNLPHSLGPLMIQFFESINLRPVWNLLFILNVMLRGSRGSMV